VEKNWDIVDWVISTLLIFPVGRVQRTCDGSRYNKTVHSQACSKSKENVQVFKHILKGIFLESRFG
jgi:hypothetical protein